MELQRSARDCGQHDARTFLCGFDIRASGCCPNVQLRTARARGLCHASSAPNEPVITSVDQGYRASYHGFTAKVRRDFSHGLTFLSHYTWSKSLDTASSQTGYIAQDHNCADCNKGLSGFNVATGSSAACYMICLLATAAATSVPRLVLLTCCLAAGQYPPSRHCSQVSIRRRLRRKTPPTSRRNSFPDVIGQFTLPNGERTVNRWFNTSAFAQPAQYRFGTASRNIIEGPGLKTTDFGIHKSFTIHEQHRIQFRFEAFNGFNNVNFALPQNNFAAADFGTIAAAGASRELQFGMKYIF